jgi:hypothetical protein
MLSLKIERIIICYILSIQIYRVDLKLSMSYFDADSRISHSLANLDRATRSTFDHFVTRTYFDYQNKRLKRAKLASLCITLVACLKRLCFMHCRIRLSLS